MFFFKINRNSQLAKLSHSFNAVLSVTCKSGNRFDQNSINFSLSAITHKTEKLIALQRTCSCYSLIRIYVNKGPALMCLNVLCIIVDLRSKGIALISGITANTGLGTYSKLFGWCKNYWFNHSNFWHFYAPFPAVVSCDSNVGHLWQGQHYHKKEDKAITTTTKYSILKHRTFRQ